MWRPILFCGCLSCSHFQRDTNSAVVVCRPNCICTSSVCQCGGEGVVQMLTFYKFTPIDARLTHTHIYITYINSMCVFLKTTRHLGHKKCVCNVQRRAKKYYTICVCVCVCVRVLVCECKWVCVCVLDSFIIKGFFVLFVSIIYYINIYFVITIMGLM